MYEATFSRGPGQNSRLTRKVPLPMFGGRRDHITSFLTSANTVFGACIRRNWPTADLLETVGDLMVPHSKAESKWSDLLDGQGVLNNMNHEEAREVVQDFLREVIGQGNLGNQAFNALRNVNHVNLMSLDYEDQLMSFDELYTHLESYIWLLKYTECSMPAADLQMASYKVKLAYVEFLHPHTKNWLEAHVQVGGNLICLYDDGGVTAHKLQQELVTYYSDNLNSGGKRIPSEAAPRTLRGDGSTRGNGNGRRRDRDDNEETNEEVN